MRRCTRIAAFAVAIALGSGADAFADDPVAAEAAFQRGLKEMKAGNYEVGCPALAESQRLEPRPGTLFTLADCEARWGKTATATIHYNDYLTRVSQLTGNAKAAHAERVQLAKARLAEIEPRVPQLTLVAPADAPSGLEVKRDGVRLGAPSMGVPIAIDPGPHTITTQAPGGPVHEIAIELAPGEKKTVELVVKPPSATPSGSASTSGSEAADSSQPSSSSPQRTIGLVVGGVGLAGIAVGAVAGILVLGQKSTVDEKCPHAVCVGDGLEDVDTMETTAMVSNIGFAAGGALAIAGAVLFFTAPSSPPKAEASGWRWIPNVGKRSAFVGVGRAW